MVKHDIDLDRSKDAALQMLVASIPYAQFLGVTCVRHGSDITAIMEFRERNIGNVSIPALHGGATGAFLELASVISLSWASIVADLEDGKLTAATLPSNITNYLPKTVDFTIDYLRSGKAKDSYARATVNRAGRRVASVHVDAWQDDRTKLFAQATGHFLMPNN